MVEVSLVVAIVSGEVGVGLLEGPWGPCLFICSYFVSLWMSFGTLISFRTIENLQNC